MKATCIAVLLSSVTLMLPVHANVTPQKQPPIVKHATEIKTASNKIDLNKADVSQLTGSFKGIGKKRAEAIIAYRDGHNGFKSLEELAEVKGFGQRFLDTNREKLKDVFVVN